MGKADDDYTPEQRAALQKKKQPAKTPEQRAKLDKGRRLLDLYIGRKDWSTRSPIDRPCALILTLGNVSDVKAAPTLIERAGACVTARRQKLRF